MKELVLHIGSMKTGTTALQNFLSTNRPELASRGLFIPEIGIKAGNYLGYVFLPKVPQFIQQKLNLSEEALFLELSREIEKSDKEKVFLSAESFFHMTSSPQLGKEFPKILKERIRKSGFRGDFKVLVYLRPQEVFLESWYKQIIKAHHLDHLYSGTIEEFFRDYEGYLDYLGILNSWAEAFGVENIIVKEYRSDLAQGHHLFEEVLKVLELGSLEGLQVPENEVNPSIGPKTAEFIRIANQFSPIKKTSSQFQELASIAQSVLGKKDSESILSKERKREIRQKYAESNYELSEKYGGGNRIFADSIEKESNRVDIQDLKIEELAKISVEIWNKYQMEIQRIEGSLKGNRTEKVSILSKIFGFFRMKA